MVQDCKPWVHCNWNAKNRRGIWPYCSLRYWGWYCDAVTTYNVVVDQRWSITAAIRAAGFLRLSKEMELFSELVLSCCTCSGLKRFLCVTIEVKTSDVQSVMLVVENDACLWCCRVGNKDIVSGCIYSELLQGDVILKKRVANGRRMIQMQANEWPVDRLGNKQRAKSTLGIGGMAERWHWSKRGCLWEVVRAEAGFYLLVSGSARCASLPFEISPELSAVSEPHSYAECCMRCPCAASDPSAFVQCCSIPVLIC